MGLSLHPRTTHRSLVSEVAIRRLSLFFLGQSFFFLLTPLFCFLDLTYAQERPARNQFRCEGSACALPFPLFPPLPLTSGGESRCRAAWRDAAFRAVQREGAVPCIFGSSPFSFFFQGAGMGSCPYVEPEIRGPFPLPLMRLASGGTRSGFQSLPR